MFENILKTVVILAVCFALCALALVTISFARFMWIAW